MIVHAYQPQLFLQAVARKKIEERYKKPQTLAILIAIQLASLHDRIDAEGYRLSDKFAQQKCPRRLPADQILQMEKKYQAAENALKTAFPEKFEKYQLRRSRTQEEKNILRELEGISSNLPLVMHTLPDAELLENEQVIIHFHQ